MEHCSAQRYVSGSIARCENLVGSIVAACGEEPHVDSGIEAGSEAGTGSMGSISLRAHVLAQYGMSEELLAELRGQLRAARVRNQSVGP